MARGPRNIKERRHWPSSLRGSRRLEKCWRGVSLLLLEIVKQKKAADGCKI